MTRTTERSAAIVVSAIAVLAVVLVADVPHDTFFSGDSGVKLIAARAAAMHPSRPLEIDLPTVGQAKLLFLEPFFLVHGDHAHAATSESFVLISAPLIAWWSVASAYVLSVVGFIAAIVGCAWLGAALDNRRIPAVTAAATAICTPFLFYAAEFWEHAPALGFASIGSALLISARSHVRRGVLAGLLLGAAVLLRPEALWFVVAMASALWLLADRPRAPALVAAALAFVASLAPITLYAVGHFGSLVTPHISGNEALLSRDWLSSRALLVAAWFGPSSHHVDVWSVAPALALAFVPLPANARRNGRAFLTTISISYCVFAVATAPNDGGAQWGPRYLLFAYIPLAIVVTDALTWLGSRRSSSAIAVAIVVWCLWVDRSGYRTLRTTKLIHGHISDFVEQQSTPTEPVVTDLWWLDQVCARLSGERTFLYASQADRQMALLSALDRAHVSGLILVRSLDESSGTVDAWFAGTCYHVSDEAEIPERRLVAIRALRRCASE